MGFITSLIPGLSFGAPLVLWALVGLPVIYWLLRVTPPAPKRILFPPLRLLLGLKSPEETPARTPLWLLLMRLLTAAIAIIALAEPIYDTTPATAGNGPLILVVDNDWAAAQQWPARVDAMHSALTGAARGNRQVTIIATAEVNPISPQWMDPRRATSTADEMVPQPWMPDRGKVLEAIAQLRPPARPEIIWLSDGVDGPGAREFADALGQMGNLSVYTDDANTTALALRPPENNANGFGVTLSRIPSNATREGRVAALDSRGRILDAAPFRFGSGEAEAATAIPLPLELRNDTTRIIVQGAESAGTVQLVDARYRRRPVGLVISGNTASPLISDIYYIERALQPYAEVRKGTLDQLVDSGIAVLALADIGQMTSDESEKVTAFVEKGGMLLRFAGPRLAAANANDSLLPVRLRQGERLMGSALAWAEQQHLAPFGEDSPFRGLPVPQDVTVGRQVLAEPSIELADHSWARLTDGTPLVTATTKGRGWVVLFHVAASPGWSTLPLSGLYVDMLRRTVGLSGGVAGAQAQRAGTLPPYQNLNGFGELVRAFPEALAIRGEDFETMVAGPQHPPGLYGNEGAVVALNAVTARTDFLPLDVGRPLFGYASGGVMRILKWPLLQIVMLVLLADALISLFLRGFVPLSGVRRWARRGATAAALLLAAGIFSDADAAAATVTATPNSGADEANMIAALDTRLAYVITGAQDVDQMSRAGLWGLGLHLRARTAYEPEDPVGVDVERDNLSFFPFLYWPMSPTQRDLSPQAVAKIDEFMRSGGTILFDTRDQPLNGFGAGAVSAGQATLQRLLAKLDIPPLQPVPPEHVLSKTFYLLKEFPGRWVGGQVWVEAIPPPKPGEDAPARGGDGVSPVIIGGNDWASAWAMDDEFMPLAPTSGGEEQRELAYRFGVNAVIYALTGNYKTDQVHVTDLLRRMGQ